MQISRQFRPDPLGARAGADDAGELGARHRQWVLVTCVIGMFSTGFTATILTVSIKTVAADLGTSPGTVAWVIVAPALAAAVSMPILGRLGDIRGHRRVYITGLALAAVFALLSACAWNATSLITFRTVGQLAGTATMPASVAILFRVYPVGERVKVVGWTSGIGWVAAVTGLVIGGPMVDAFGWRPLFVAQAVLASIALVFALVTLVPDRPGRAVPLDRQGAAALGVTALALTFGLNRLPVWGPRHPLVLLCGGVFVAGVLALPRIERRQAAPIVPVELLRSAKVRAAWATTFWTGACFVGTMVVTPLLLQDTFGMSVTTSSWVTLCRTGAGALGSFSAGWLASRLGARRMATTAALAMVAGSLVIASGAHVSALALVMLGLVVSGIGSGAVQPVAVAVIANTVATHDLGVAASMNQTMMSIGAVTGTSLFSAIATGTGGSRYALVYAIAAGGAVVCAACTTRFGATASSGATESDERAARALEVEEPPLARGL